MTNWKIHFTKLWLTQNILFLKLLLYCTFFAIFLELCALPPPPLIICYVKVRCQSIYVWTDMTHILSELWFDLRKTSTILIDSICNVWEISQFGWILIRFPLCSDNFEIEISDKNVVHMYNYSLALSSSIEKLFYHLHMHWNFYVKLNFAIRYYTLSYSKF